MDQPNQSKRQKSLQYSMLDQTEAGTEMVIVEPEKKKSMQQEEWTGPGNNRYVEEVKQRRG